VIQHESEASAHAEARLLCGHVPEATRLGGRREVEMDPRHLVFDEPFEEYRREDVVWWSRGMSRLARAGGRGRPGAGRAGGGGGGGRGPREEAAAEEVVEEQQQEGGLTPAWLLTVHCKTSATWLLRSASKSGSMGKGQMRSPLACPATVSGVVSLHALACVRARPRRAHPARKGNRERGRGADRARRRRGVSN